MTETVNIHGTGGCSLTPVLPGLAKMRRAHGYNTPIGRRCSNILEMMDAGTAKPGDIADQVRQLAGLVSKGDRG